MSPTSCTRPTEPTISGSCPSRCSRANGTALLLEGRMNHRAAAALVLGLGLLVILATPRLQAARGTGVTPGQSITLLADGRTLIIGGIGPDGPMASAAVQDPGTGVVTPMSPGPLYPRAWHTATALPDGTVLILGG